MKQPEVLRLADALEALLQVHPFEDFTVDEAAFELRRLYKVNQMLLEAVKAALSDDQPYIEKCRAAIEKAGEA